MTTIPNYAMLVHPLTNTKERVRVLAYVSPDVFRILTSKDHTYRIPRERLVFLK